MEVNTALADLLQSIQENEWITAQEAMKRTGLTYNQVKTRIDRGTFDTQMMGKKVMISGYSVSKYLEKEG